MILGSLLLPGKLSALIQAASVNPVPSTSKAPSPTESSIPSKSKEYGDPLPDSGT